MEKYQEQYIENTRMITRLSDIYSVPLTDFDSWYQTQLINKAQMESLKEDNNRILTEYLFPVLDNLHDADENTIKDLDEFSSALMDGQTNLDCGVYSLIHEALLSLYRFRKDTDGIIRELYKLGMGRYYQNKTLQGLPMRYRSQYMFENELLFTEGGSYLRFFEQIENEETKGYIIRCLANVAITAVDRKKRIATTSKVLKIIQDDYYRSQAPGLPWDNYLRASWQQMSSNRNVLSKGNLTSDELSEILEACQIVFEPEKDNDNPNIRWLWPYYEMEYSCGFVDLETTLDRMEELINNAPEGEYDVSALYGNIQLPIYYGSLLERNAETISKKKYVFFLNHAYEKMMKTLLSCPPEERSDMYYYVIAIVLANYYETEGVPSYKEITKALMPKIAGNLYIDSLKMGKLLECYCGFIYNENPQYFDDIDFIAKIRDPEKKREAVEQYAQECGLYYDFGLNQMNLDTTLNKRNLFDYEDNLYQLHCRAGYVSLARRASTEKYALVALGHHKWYDGNGGYPEDYLRNESAYRQMTDIVSIVRYLVDEYKGDINKNIEEIISQEHRRFSPLATVFLHEEKLVEELKEILDKSDVEYYQNIYEQINNG